MDCINITQCETINEDFVLIFYDLLSELRLVDLTVLKLYGRYYINDEIMDVNSYDDVLGKHKITMNYFTKFLLIYVRLGSTLIK